MNSNDLNITVLRLVVNLHHLVFLVEKLKPPYETKPN
jgi:hypothetical protein